MKIVIKIRKILMMKIFSYLNGRFEERLRKSDGENSGKLDN